MTKRHGRTRVAGALRQRAEAFARQEAARATEAPESLTSEEFRRTLHELRVHQIELEMQNEELRHAQVEIDAARARYFDLYDLAPAGYCTLSEQGRILEANLTLVTLLGSSRDALIQQLFSRFIVREDQDIYYLHRKKLLETGEPQECELRLVRPDGAPFWAHLKGTVARAEDGAPLCRFIISDITERKRLQIRLAQSDRLSTMGTLAAGVAHEINNPLTYMLFNIESLSQDVPKLAELMRRCHAALCSHLGADGVNELLGADADSLAMFDDVADRFRDVLSGTIRIKDIARGLSTFSRVEGSAVEPVNLQHAAEQAINLVSNQIKVRARLAKSFGQVPLVLGSESQLAQVFLNLLINAVHAIDEGHVEDNEIRIRTWAEGEEVFAEVSDTGKGIPLEHQDRIFQPFFTTKEVGVGSGLGLSISRNIVNGFGGEISFSSEPGKGTRFLIRLPRLPRDWQPREASTQQDASSPSTPRGRILVVDDEPVIRAIIARMLGRHHEIVTAASGQEARAILERDGRFDLIFCDLMMPRISGMELHAWLAEHDADLAARMVFMTGGAFTPGAEEYLARVGNLRLQKPFDTVAFTKLADELVLAARTKLDRGD